MDDADRPSSEPPPSGEEHPDGSSPPAEALADAGTRHRSETPPPVDRPAYAEVQDAEPERPRSAMPVVLAVIGVVLIGLLVANLYMLYNPPANEAVSALQREVASLRQSFETLSARPAVDLGPLDGRVSGLAGDVDHLKADLAQAAAAAGAAAADAAAAKAATAPLDSRITATDAKVAAAETRSTAADAKVAATETKLTATDAKVAAAGTKLTATDAKVAAAETRMAATDAKVAAIDKRLAPLEAYVNGPKADAQVTAARQNGSAAETRAAPLAVTAHGILGALSTGRPFEAEAKALATLGVDEATRAPLDAVAVKGAATDADLLAGFGAVRDAIVVAGAPIPVSTGTMFDRMMANAQSLVKVNPTGAIPGEDAQAITTRIEAALKEGRLAAAAAEWDKLPQASKARSAEWSERLKARIAAEAAAHAIETQAVAALAAAQ